MRLPPLQALLVLLAYAAAASAADPLASFSKLQRTVLPWATPLQTVNAPDAATVAAACLNFSAVAAAAAPPPPCVWSALLPNTWLSGCASGAGGGDVNCIHFDALADAQAACVADADCGGVTSQNSGVAPWELRKGPAPQPSPTNESSYAITNAAACHAQPAACNAFDTSGRLYQCPGGRCDCDADAGFCARGRDIFSVDPAVGFGSATTDLFVARGADVPPEWAARVAAGAVLFASPEPQVCYMPEIGNGYLATVASWASLHIGGLFNGACGTTHKATLSSPVAYTVPGAALVGSALDMEAGAFLRRWALPGGAVVEARVWAHRVRKHVVVADFSLLPGTAPGAVVVPLASLFDPRSVAGAGDGCSSGFTSDFAWTGPSGVGPQTWAGVTTLSSDKGQRPNVSIALDAPPANVSLSPAQPSVRLIAAFAASIDFPGGAGSAADVAALAAAEYAAASAASPADLWAEHASAWAALLASGVDVAPASADPGDVARALDIATHANASRYFLLSSVRSDVFAGVSPGGIASCSYNGAVFMDADWWS